MIEIDGDLPSGRSAFCGLMLFSHFLSLSFDTPASFPGDYDEILAVAFAIWIASARGGHGQ